MTRHTRNYGVPHYVNFKPVQQPRSRWKGWAVSTLAAVLIAAVIVGILLLTGDPK